MKPLLLRFTGALSVSLALLPQPAGAASSPEAARADSTERARDLFERGIAAWDANQLEEALVLLTESWELSRSFDVGGSLGQVEELLGRHRDAAEHLHHSLRNFPVGESRELRANIEATLQKAMAQVGSVRVLVDEPQARLIVDGEDVGEAPGDGYVFVEPGAHTILARLGARTSETRTLEVQAGGKYVVDLALAPEAMPPARAPGALTQGRSGAAEWKLPVMLGAGAFAMTGLGVGTYFAVERGRLDRESRDLRSELEPGACAAVRTGPCADLAANARSADRAQRASVAGFVTGGVFAAGVVAAWLLWPERQSSSASWTARPLVGAPGLGQQAGFLGAELSGSF